MNKDILLAQIKPLYHHIIDDNNISKIILKYLESFPLPKYIGVTYNKSYRVDTIKSGLFFSKKIYLVVECLTVNCEQNGRWGVETFENRAWGFYSSYNAEKFCYLKNLLYNHEMKNIA